MHSKIHPLRRFLKLLEADRKDIYNLYVYAVLAGIIGLSLPLGIQAIINLITIGQLSTSWAVLVSLVIAGVIVAGLMQVMQLRITESLQQRIFLRTSFEYSYRLPRIKLEATDKYYLPELVNRFFDSLSIQKGLPKVLIEFSTAVLQIVFGLILLSLYHPSFILFGVLLSLIIFLIIKLTGQKGLSTSINESNYKYEMAHWLEEISRTMKSFKVTANTDLLMQKTDEVAANYLGYRKQHFKILQLQYFGMIAFKAVVASGLLIIGSILVVNQKINLGQFVAAEIIIVMVVNSVEKLILSTETIYDVLTAVEKLSALTDLPLDKEEGESVDVLQMNSGPSISIKNLSFAFPNQKGFVLNNLSLDIKPSERVVIAGYNSSGKSTLLQLIAGIYNQYSGSILINNLPCGNLNKSSLRSQIGLSLSNDNIFKARLYDNIVMGRSGISFDTVRWVSEKLLLDDFVKSTEKGFDTILETEGRKLSRSVVRKILLARSIVHRPRILLLENPTDEIDSKKSDAIVNFLSDRSIDCTVLAVSNNLELAEKFDRVIVLKNGSIIGEGKVEELKKYDWFKDVFR
ncbi:MAG: ATP-binding cassette domain-containing protein [Bacteroidetes bacterium]|nr:ATP-binding cassette domain-containing protein [Bacteroidota bacterium]